MNPGASHVMGFRRQVFMVLNKDYPSLNVILKFTVNSHDYQVYVNSDTLKCFGCGAVGHMKQFCPLRKTQLSTAEPNNDSQINVNVSLSTNVQDKPAERVDTSPPNDVQDKLVQQADTPPPNDVQDKLTEQVDTPPPNDVQDKLTEQVDTPPPNELMDSVSDGFITVSKVKIYHQRWGIPHHWMKKVTHIPENEGGELETRHHLVIVSKKFPRGEERSNQK